jgi:hypothetical protein
MEDTFHCLSVESIQKNEDIVAEAVSIIMVVRTEVGGIPLL